MAIDTSKLKTGEDLISNGIRPTTAKENLAYVLERRIDALREKNGHGNHIYEELYPNTVIPSSTAYILTTGLIAGIDILVFGPPGTGKTTLAHDIIDLFPRFNYVVDGCANFQCNPFSLFDPEFYARIKPCPTCKAQYGGEAYRSSRLFDPTTVDPGRVKVKFVYFNDGYGISRIMGTPDTFPQDLTGVVNLRKLQEIGDPFDKEVFTAGKLPQGNNGLVYLNELGKIPSKSQSALLDAMQEKEVKPANTREPVPSSAVYICDTNTKDLDKIMDPLNDRVLKVHFGYHPDIKGNRKIIRKTVYGSRATPAQYDYEEIWKADRTSLLELPIPSPLEDGIAAFMVSYRSDPLSEKYAETKSNRVMTEAVKLARANAKLSRRSVANSEDVMRSVTQSILGKTKPSTEKEYASDKEKLIAHIGSKLAEKIGEASIAYWCQFQHDSPGTSKRASEELERAEHTNGWKDVINGKQLENASAFWKFVEKEHSYVPKDDDVKAELLKETYRQIKAAEK